MNEFNGYQFEELEVGMTAAVGKTVTEADLVLFGAVSGDNNPVHFNEAYAATTMFKTRIAHGMLSAAFISAVIGTRLPGPGAIYLSQSLKFKAPVRIGDTVTATVTVKELIPEKKRALLTTICTVKDTVVVEGEALVMIPGAH